MYARSIHKDDDKPAATAGARFVQTCQIPGCAAGIPRRHLMCPQHWSEVPAELQDDVWLSLAFWLGRKDDVRSYLKARLRAIIHVCNLHQINVRNFEAQLARWTRSTFGTL